MGHPIPKRYKIVAISLLVAVVSAFIFKTKGHVSDLSIKNNSQIKSVAIEDPWTDDPISVEILKSLEWNHFNGIVRKIGNGSDKINHVLRLSSGLKNPVAAYLHGFLLMVESRLSLALDTFDRLTEGDIPAAFLYPPYRLHQEIRPLALNKYLKPLRKAVADDRVTTLIKARFHTKDGNPYAAVSDYMQTDPAQWALYDIECLEEIAMHSGLHSEVLRMVSGVLNSGRVLISRKIEKRLRQIFLLETG